MSANILGSTDESILGTIKKLLGGAAETSDHFDTDIIIHINSTLAILNQIGIGPSEGFKIHDDETSWKDFINDEKKFEDVKTFVYLKVKLIFDPPTNSSVLNSMKELISEIEWRLNLDAETE